MNPISRNLFSNDVMSVVRRADRLDSGQRDALVEIDVLDGVDKLRSLVHWTLKGLSTDNEALSAGSLVDHSSSHCLF